jgi:hypothetical protein
MYRRPGADRDQSLHELDSYVTGPEVLPKHHNEDQIVQAI